MGIVRSGFHSWRGATNLDLFFVLDSRLGTGSVDGPNVLMERISGKHKYYNKKNNDKEENKGWFAILRLQLLQPLATEPRKSSRFVRHGPLVPILLGKRDILQLSFKIGPFETQKHGKKRCNFQKIFVSQFKHIVLVE